MPSGTSYPFSTVTNLIVPKAVTESKQNLPYHLSEPQEPNMRFSAGSPQGNKYYKKLTHRPACRLYVKMLIL